MYSCRQQVCDQILAAAPGDGDALHSKIVSLIELSKTEDALKVLEATPALAERCVFEKAYCLYSLYREDEALQLLMPKGAEPSEARELQLAGQIKYRKGDSAAAAALLQKAEAVAGPSAELSTNILAALVSAGKGAEALGTQRQRPQVAAPLATTGRTLSSFTTTHARRSPRDSSPWRRSCSSKRSKCAELAERRITRRRRSKCGANPSPCLASDALEPMPPPPLLWFGTTSAHRPAVSPLATRATRQPAASLPRACREPAASLREPGYPCPAPSPSEELPPRAVRSRRASILSHGKAEEHAPDPRPAHGGPSSAETQRRAREDASPRARGSLGAQPVP